MLCFGRNEGYLLMDKGSPRSYTQQHVWRENPSLLGCYTVSSCEYLHGPKDEGIGTDTIRCR
jgi:hypothetical protein